MKILLLLFGVIFSVLIGGLCGLLAAWTGQGGSKSMRRVVAPAIVTVFSMLVLRRISAVLLMFRAGVLSQGYGTSDPTDPKPSTLGAFWFKIFKKNQKRAAIATRATIGLQEGIVCAVIPFLTGHWIWYFPIAIAIIGNWVYFGAIKKNEGTFKMFGKEFLWEEIEIHGINSFVIALLAMLSV